MKLYVLRIAFLLCVMLFSMHGRTQQVDTYLIKNLTLEHGLPSNEIYHIVEDEDHLLWMATDNGLVKYDGSIFQVFTTSTGLPNNEILHFFKQPNGTYYGLCKYNRFFNLYSGKIIPYEFNDVIRSSISDYAKTYSFYIDNRGTTHLGTSYGYFSINKVGKIVKNDLDAISQINYGRLSLLRHFDYLLTYNSISNDSINVELIDMSGNKPRGLDTSPRNMTYEYNYSIAMEKDRNAIIHNGMVYIINSSGVSQIVKTKCRPVSVGWHDSSLWVGALSDGIYQYKQRGDSLYLHDHLLYGLTVTSVCKDFQGGYWFSTRENGIYHLNDFNIVTFYKSGRLSYISAFARLDNRNVIGYEDGKVHFPEDSTHDFDLKTKIISFSAVDYNHFGIGLHGRMYNYDLEKRKLEVNPLFTDGTGLSALNSEVLNENQQAYFSLFYFLIYDYSLNEFVYRLDFDSKSIFTDYLMAGDKIVIGKSRDVVIFNWKTRQVVDSVKFESNVVSLMEHQNKLIVACKDGGIHVFPEYKLNGTDKFQSEANSISDATIFKNQLIISTNSGVQKYEFDEKEGKWRSSESIYLLGVKKIEILKDTIYYVTKDRILIDLNKPTRKAVPITQIESININGKENVDSINEFAYNENNVVFKMSAISYSAPFRNYKFQLIGIDQEYRVASDDYINYPSLAPGEYEFVISGTTNGVDYSEPQRVKFTILAPFWSTTWFLALSVIFIFGSIGLMFLYRIRKMQSKLILQKSIAELKSRALTSQLNPHLVFNILNSIQGIISKGEIENANRYLARFSKFMRKSLALSKHTRISLEEEIEITQNYIDLELLRFPDQLDITISNDVSASNHLVPPLIIQPFVENAIKHGIMPSKRERGKVHIHFSEDNDAFRISIEDNGVGFAGEIDFLKGDGMRISKERLEILNPKNRVTLDADKTRTKIILVIYS